jgi:hypothetical protein
MHDFSPVLCPMCWTHAPNVNTRATAANCKAKDVCAFMCDHEVMLAAEAPAEATMVLAITEQDEDPNTVFVKRILCPLGVVATVFSQFAVGMPFPDQYGLVWRKVSLSFAWRQPGAMAYWDVVEPMPEPGCTAWTWVHCLWSTEEYLSKAEIKFWCSVHLATFMCDPPRGAVGDGDSGRVNLTARFATTM